MGGKKQTIGYHYLFDILFGLSRGPLNELRQIKVADKVAYDGPLCNSDVNAIYKPDLFGGDKKEGGIQGPFRVLFGKADQVLPGDGSTNCGSKGPYGGNRVLKGLRSLIPGPFGDLRGVTTLHFSGLISSMNPYPKEWSFRVRRQTKGWHLNQCWYLEKAVIFMADGKVHAMNPAHIIYQLLTDPLFRGLPVNLIDEPSFVYAANTLCAEGFGLCFVWQRQEEIDQFLQIVLDHIGAALYPDPETGRMVLRLLRGDYVAADLPLYTKTSGLVEIKQDDSASQDGVYSEVVGKGKDPIENKDISVRVHNLAARMSQGATNTSTKDYSGIPTRDLLARVCQRDLRMYAAGLKKFEVVLDRRGWKLRPGMCFRVQDDRRGFGMLVLRVGEIMDQSFRDGKITIKCAQDVFGLPDTSFVAITEPTWEAPPQSAVPATESRLVEANYRDIVLRRDESAAQTLDGTDAVIGMLALSPHPAMYEYVLASRALGEDEFDEDMRGGFTGAATLVDAITVYQTTFAITGETDFAESLEGQAILIDDEQMELVNYDPTTHMVTVTRGVADTIPQAHAAAATLWTIDDDLVSDGRTYAAGETVEAYALTATYSDVLAIEAGTKKTLVLGGRQGRPYPPGDVRVGGDPALALTPFKEYTAPLIAWAHRDRILQADQLVGHAAGSTGLEPGASYTIRIYPFATPDVAVRTVPGIMDASWTYDNDMWTADGSPSRVYIELETVRDGLASYQKYRFPVVIAIGYGTGYGMNYGGKTV